MKEDIFQGRTMSFEEELRKCPLANFGVQTILHSNGCSLLLTMHAQDGTMIAHSIYDKVVDVRQMVKAMNAFIMNRKKLKPIKHSNAAETSKPTPEV